MKVTAKMIAEELGISTATVDRVLNNRKGVSEKNIHIVKQKAKELGYQPNRAAKFLSTQKVVRVAFILPVFPDYFWNELEMEIKEAASLYADFGFQTDVHRIHTIPQNDQLDYMEELIEQDKYQAFVIAPHDAKPTESVINKAMDKNIPVFTINTDVPDSQRIAYVGSDYYDAGYLAGELIYLFQKDLSNMVLIREKENTFQMQQKENGFLDFFKEKRMENKVQIVKYNKSAYIQKEQVGELLHDHKELFNQSEAVYVAGGIIDELQKYWFFSKKTHIIIGHDINQTIYNAINKGVITATICQDPMAQAAITLKKLTKYFLDENVTELDNHIVKLEIVTRANAKYYLKNTKSD
ncbi:LacI family transcriptional regulator [Gracilibacillus orientalis]|uniref:LacI family transcriptional regulator n=1 Tax=Gracilibacillus orientalis TaxID=334253 RepID=A0A1I4HZV9_9BACI|nr:LacI family DNA-binding transcriptional regulator [Gracilibacillus orientalis]SFL47131.1 LacI family transcriptional regulator [Gracilibacillus orientalis]